MERVTKLKKKQIFVFGSNLNGNHLGGAAKDAIDYFGAIQGQPEGLQGQSYAIPTLDKAMKKLRIAALRKYVLDFLDFARNNPKKEFVVTPIGTGIAGFKKEKIVPLFRNSPVNVILPEEFKLTVKGYKAFEKGLVCKGYQFKEDSIAEYDGDIEVCAKGFHFCENPFDVLNYYELTESEFAEVEAIGEIQKHSDDSKVVTNKLRIGVKLELPTFVKACIDFLFEHTKVNNKDEAVISDAGDSSQVATSGYYSQVATSGDYSQVATSGYYSQVATSGDYSKVATSGYSSQVATSGYYSKVATSGDYSQVATSGYYSQVATSGYYSQVATSGDYSSLELKGQDSVGANIGIGGMAKGVKGSWITLAEYNDDYRPVCVKSAMIDGKKIKENVFYKLEGKKFVEV